MTTHRSHSIPGSIPGSICRPFPSLRGLALGLALLAGCDVDDQRVHPRAAVDADVDAPTGGEASSSESLSDGALDTGDDTGETPDGKCGEGKMEQEIDCGFKLAKLSGGPLGNSGEDCNYPTYTQDLDKRWTATVTWKGKCNCVWTPIKGKKEVSPVACGDVDPGYTAVPKSKACEEKGIVIPEKEFAISKDASSMDKDGAMFAAEKKCKEAAAAECVDRCTKVEAKEKPTTKLACCVPSTQDGGTDDGGDCTSESGDACPEPEPEPEPEPAPEPEPMPVPAP